MVGTGIDLVVHLGMFHSRDRVVRRLASIAFVDQNVENPSNGPAIQEVCRYRVADGDWEWDLDALRFLPGKIRAKLEAAGIDDQRLRQRVRGSDGS